MPEKTFKDDEALPKEPIEGYSRTDQGLPQLVVIPPAAPPEPQSFKKLMWRLVFALGLILVVLAASGFIVMTIWNNATVVTTLPEIDFTTAFGFVAAWRVLALLWRM